MDEVVARLLSEYPGLLWAVLVTVVLGFVIRYFVKDRDFWRSTALRALNVGEAAATRSDRLAREAVDDDS